MTKTENQIEQEFIAKLGELKYTYRPDIRDRATLEINFHKIVDTYQYRKEEVRYARRVSMAEIEKNGFNLNISRYVSTAMAEKEVDLKSVHEQLVDIEKDIKQAKDKYNDFLRQLGLPLLP